MIMAWPGAMSGLGGANQFAGDLLFAGIIAGNFAGCGQSGALWRAVAGL